MPLILGILAQGVGAAPGGAGAYDLLETQVLSSDAASVSFTGLGSYTDYKHLQLRLVTKTDVATTNNGSLRIRMNGDTGSNYAAHHLNGTGSTVASTANTSQSAILLLEATVGNSTANIFAPAIIDILDFSNVAKNTTTRSLQGLPAGENDITLSSGLWNNTAAVTEIYLDAGVGDGFVAGSRFSLYGIKGA